MKTKRLLLNLLTIFGMSLLATAGEKLSDAAIKQKLIGYWQSPRHGYLIKSDGVMYMLGGTTTNRWDVKGGIYYEDPFDTIVLTNKKFVVRSRGT
jgi:hypothetical protein